MSALRPLGGTGRGEGGSPVTTTATLEVSIMGQSYVLACPEGEQDALRKAVAEVDREMCSIRDLGRIRARERIAVLAVLNLAHAKLIGAPAGESQPPAELGPRLQRLQQRLDAALDEDGQLL